MHPVLRRVVRLHRQEGARPDMQRHGIRARCPAASSRASSSGVKCSPAVGAATAPSVRGKDRLVVVAVARRPPAAARRCRAAAARRRWRGAPRRDRRRGSRSASRTRPSARFSSTVASSVPSRQTPSLVPEADAVAGREAAGRAWPAPTTPRRRSARSASRATGDRAPSRIAHAGSCAGITLVSLKTSTSPARSSSGRSRTRRSSSPSPGRTTSSRAASRGSRRPQRDPLLRQLEIELARRASACLGLSFRHSLCLQHARRSKLTLVNLKFISEPMATTEHAVALERSRRDGVRSGVGWLSCEQKTSAWHSPIWGSPRASSDLLPQDALAQARMVDLLVTECPRHLKYTIEGLVEDVSAGCPLMLCISTKYLPESATASSGRPSMPGIFVDLENELADIEREVNLLARAIGDIPTR